MQSGGMDISRSAALQKQLSSLGGSLDFGADAISQHLVHSTTMSGYVAMHSSLALLALSLSHFGIIDCCELQN